MALKCRHCSKPLLNHHAHARYCDEKCQALAKAARVRARYIRTGHRSEIPERRRYSPGDTFGQLVLVAYLPARKGNSRALFRCECGNVTEKALRNVVQGKTLDCADRQSHPNPRRVAVPAYGTFHKQLVMRRGSASAHPCFLACGRQAEQWAYMHSDPQQLVQSTGKDAGRVYSIDPAHYWPLCRKCHGRRDRARRAYMPLHVQSLAHHAFWLAHCNDLPQGAGLHSPV